MDGVVTWIERRSWTTCFDSNATRGCDLLKGLSARSRLPLKKCLLV
jgi:hypothetical protein